MLQLSPNSNSSMHKKIQEMIHSTFPNPVQFPTIQVIAHFKLSVNNNTNKINNKGFNLLHTQTIDKPRILQSLGICKCGRRHFMETIATTLLQSSLPSLASQPNSSSMELNRVLCEKLEDKMKEMLRKIHPQKADWYEEFYASVMNGGMKAYEAEIAGYKSQLFDNLSGQAEKILEIGVGTGPNLKYYASGARMIFGIDPNRKMEKYARRATETAGVLPENFEFMQAVGEALPLNDASVDAVIGTLVLCSVEDVRRTLQEVKRVLKPGGVYLFVEHVAAKDGTSLRFLQNLVDPLQQLLADGCHLTRETGKYISEAGFSSVDSSTTFISNAVFVNPQLYGIAYK